MTDHPYPAPSAADRRHLQRLTSEWGMLSDFCFSDLVLYEPTWPVRAGADAPDFLIVDHIRPATSQTIYRSNLIGERRSAARRPLVAAVYESGRSAEGEFDSAWAGDRIRVHAIPVTRDGRPIAVLARESALSIRREAGELEQTYESVFARFAEMIAAGEFPFALDDGPLPDGPRVGDGVIVTDGTAEVVYASPNATTALTRSGLDGNVVGHPLAAVVPEAPTVLDSLGTARPVSAEIETVADTVLSVRAIPLVREGAVTGAVVLVRDVSELRRRDRLLLSKDATIREIHHRVKNNLQTISSLLRLQGRRLTEPSAREAIEESVRRIRSIAVVHEILAHHPGDDLMLVEIVRPLARLVEDSLVSPEEPVHFVIDGDAGVIAAPVATSLAVVLTELFQNAVEHAYPAGTDLSQHPAEVRLLFERDPDRLAATVTDDGVGLPADFDSGSASSLGLSIVRTLVTSELGGTITIGPGEGTDPRPGTRVRLEIPV